MSPVPNESGAPQMSCPLCLGALETRLSLHAREVACPHCDFPLWFAAGEGDQPPYVVVSVATASLDEVEERALGRRIVEELNAPSRVVIDVSRSTATTSVGIARLLRLHTKLKRAGVAMRLRGVQPFLRKTLTMVGLEKVFPLDKV